MWFSPGSKQSSPTWRNLGLPPSPARRASPLLTTTCTRRAWPAPAFTSVSSTVLRQRGRSAPTSSAGVRVPSMFRTEVSARYSHPAERAVCACICSYLVRASVGFGREKSSPPSSSTYHRGRRAL